MRWIGAFEDCASCTSLTICASMVSVPTLVARMVKAPVVLMVAPMTTSPSPLSTGTDSPVTIDSSSVERPRTMTPSTGTFSPGRTTISSPGTTSSTGISVSVPPFSTRAVRGASSTRERIASPVPARAPASMSRPSRMIVMMKLTTS